MTTIFIRTARHAEVFLPLPALTAGEVFSHVDADGTTRVTIFGPLNDSVEQARLARGRDEALELSRQWEARALAAEEAHIETKRCLREADRREAARLAGSAQVQPSVLSIGPAWLACHFMKIEERTVAYLQARVDAGLIESPREMWSAEVKHRAYQLDPECWKSYSGKPRDFKRRMEPRRIGALQLAKLQLESSTDEENGS